MLKSLDTSKATWPDGISSKMLKGTAVSITPSLTRLIKLSISTEVPQCWKQANVFPIYKKGDKSDCGNSRPVSLLNVTSYPMPQKDVLIALSLPKAYLCDYLQYYFIPCKTVFSEN